MEQGGTELSGLHEQAEGLEQDEILEDLPDEEAEESGEPIEENARETVERLLREGKEENAGPEGSKPEIQGEKPAKLVKGKQDPAAKEEFNIPAPSRLTLEQKEMFNQLPAPLKKAAHGMFRAHEAEFTRTMQAVQHERADIQHVREAVRPYLLQNPHLMEAGFTEGRFVSALVAAHQQLSNPETAAAAVARVAEDAGIDPEIVAAIRGQQGQAPTQNRQPQNVTALPEEVRGDIAWIRQQRQQAFNTEYQQASQELSALQNEVGQNGRYSYPLLHDNDFLERWKPLVSVLGKTMPGLPFIERCKRAYATLAPEMQPPMGNFPQGNQARFPAQQQTSFERANQAAVSVRGRSAPAASGNPSEPPPEALTNDPRDTVRWALNQMRRG